MRPAVRLAAALLSCGPALAQRAPDADPWTACRQAIAAAERGRAMPPGLMLAIAQVETTV